uniref:EGF-like domain-containing protein n=1 Tax=Magallana gigas TaxID=29159 RepID=A0A8W8MLF6_MAGGI
MSCRIVRMHFMTSFVVFLVVSSCSGDYCLYRKGRTNENKRKCTGLEHCVSNFNPQTGDCLDPGNQCEPGWMGPGCQYGKKELISFTSSFYQNSHVTTIMVIF